MSHDPAKFAPNESIMCVGRNSLVALLVLCSTASVHADVGDPQLATEHPWYPGEGACSTFEKLFATQEAVYKRVTGRECTTDEDRALASWLWRNTHYWHGEEGGADLWGQGLGKGNDTKLREYWTGLYAHGFSLCGTTHAQWVGEMQARFGHGRGRSVGTAGHNSFEVFLKGGTYGDGRWVLLDHDLSTVVFAPDGSRLLGIDEVARDWRRLTSRTFQPNRQRGWLPAGLHQDDAGSLAQYSVAEYLSGYAGPPPRVHLRRGETLRRYMQPGLDDGKTYVFWGRNYNTQGIPGPERSRTWVNQPDAMYRSTSGTPHRDGQARYANAMYTYRPDFGSGDYREGIIDEGDSHVTFSFQSPYVIGATPPNSSPWGIYDVGCKNGLVLRGKVNGDVSVSVDRGRTWSPQVPFRDGLDLTDHVKGHHQYWLKLGAPAKGLRTSKFEMTTICQANAAVMPQLTDDGCKVTYSASRRAVESAGPNLPQAEPHVVGGGFGTPTVTLALRTPQGQPVRHVYAAAHVLSSSPPDPKILYQIEYSQDQGKTWQPLVKDWSITRQGTEPRDFWSQSLCWGDRPLQGGEEPVWVRFRNNGGKRYARAEMHLEYETRPLDPVAITYSWTDTSGPKVWTTTVKGEDADFIVPTGKNTQTRWVEIAVPAMK